MLSTIFFFISKDFYFKSYFNPLIEFEAFKMRNTD
jgi:hypothetical protein